MTNLAQEAIVVGAMTVAIGLLVSWGYSKLIAPQKQIPDDSFLPMVIALFITGVLVHVTCEFSGINDFYCQYRGT